MLGWWISAGSKHGPRFDWSPTLADLRTILITGAPAAGKTTMRSVIREEASAALDAMLELGIDDVLQEMYYAGQLDGAHVDHNGALLLGRPDVDVPRAMLAVCQKRLAHAGTAIIEVPIVDGWFAALREEHAGTAAETLVVYLRASLATRLARNRARCERRILPENLMRMPSKLRPDDAEAILSSFWGMLALDTERSLGQTSALVRAATAAMLDGSGNS